MAEKKTESKPIGSRSGFEAKGGETGTPLGRPAGSEIIQQQHHPEWSRRPPQWTDTVNGEGFSSAKATNGAVS